jgi:hypothetical protein
LGARNEFLLEMPAPRHHDRTQDPHLSYTLTPPSAA